MTLNALKIRQDFPMLRKKVHGHPLIYFDSAATTQKPQVVIDTIRDFYENQYGTVHRAVYQLAAASTEAYFQARQQVQTFLNASCPEEIIFTRGTTEGINLVAHCLGQSFIQKDDEILISQLEHHSNIVPWQLLCERTGARLKVIPAKEDGDLDLQAYASLLSEKTKLVSVAHIANAIGSQHPIQLMIKMAHDAGSLILIDAAQSVPHLPINLQELNPDFLVFSGHKTYGPTGIGVLFGKYELLEKLPPHHGGGDMIDTVTFDKTTYNIPPLRFEAGTPMIAEALGLAAALKYLSKIGMSAISTYEQSLTEYAVQKLSQIERLRIIGHPEKRGSLIPFVVDQIHALDLGSLLDLKGVALRTGHHCAQPAMHHFGLSSTCRISFGIYNTKEEVDHFTSILESIIKLLA